MLTDDELERVANQLTAYRNNDTLPDILDKYAVLIEDYKRLKSDYEEERDAREKYKQMARGQERNPFVLVLVDGDGYVFNDELISRGASDSDSTAERLSRGGTNAAQLLNDTIKASLRRKGLEHCQVMVRVYANVAGLSKALSKSGLIGAEKRSFAPFIAAFNRSSGLSDFVDAGDLKENADFKLRALLQLYAENAQCKHIYVAACHDVGYINDLQPYRGNSARFTLINSRGIKFHDEFGKLGMGIEELPGVFRSTPLDGPAFYRPPHAVLSSANAASTKPPPSPARQSSNNITSTTTSDSQKEKAVCEFYKIGRCKYGSGCKFLHVGRDTTNNNTNAPWRSSSNNNETSTDEQRSISPSKTLPRREDIPFGQVAVNKNKYRLDSYIAPPSTEANAELKARIARHRICNNYHLNGFCEAGDTCTFDHSPLDAELKRALESLARSQPCPKRGACRKATCTGGHVCQSLDCKNRGGKAYCKLPYSSHSEDLTVADYVPAETRPRQSRQTSSYAVNGSSTAGGSSVRDDDADARSYVTTPSGVDDDDGDEGVQVRTSNGAHLDRIFAER